ncbi:MAG: NarK/NasA family nitrate transporter [Fimbriimonadaceae bacterium]|nr:NarK/NasA family nitrate transporter [Fimbriimonadaceae bacterium]
MGGSASPNRTLLMNIIAFTSCFAVWTMYGVLITYLVDNKVLVLDKSQVGLLIGVPILTGSIMRLPIGILTDRLGGRTVFLAVMLFSAAAVLLTSFANSFATFLLGGLLFGMSGTSFSAGVAYTSLYFPKEKQGTALGLFGMGNVGAALTTLGAPALLDKLTNGGQNLDGWRQLPMIYAGILVATAALFAIFTENKRSEGAGTRTLANMLNPLRDTRVWRFGLYYFLLFGGFVALAQWLVPYYVNVYGMSLATAGVLASAFSLPSAMTRAIGGFVADRFGARTTLYWVLSGCTLLFLLLMAPRMDIRSPGEGIMADRAGTVTAVAQDAVTIGEQIYTLKVQAPDKTDRNEANLILPTFQSWQEPAVQVGQEVKKKELVARGVTHVYFQANQWVFTALVLLAGLLMGVGMAAIFKHIPNYYPNDVGAVGGIVGVVGGLGGFVCPIIFGYLLKSAGLWTSCWFFFAMLALISVVWMHLVVLKLAKHTDVGDQGYQPQ